MKAFYEIKKGIWALDLERINEYHDLAQNVLNGTFNTTSSDTKNTTSVKTYLTENGQITNQKSTSKSRYYGIVDLIGPVMRYDNCWEMGSESLVNYMKNLHDDPDVIGIIVKGDTPGGAVSAVNPFIDFHAYRTKPIVGIFDQCCSLGMWAASTFDHIMAENTISSRFGSIGVVMSFNDISGYLEKQGIKKHEIYPEESGYKNLAFNLAMEGKYDMIKKDYLSPIAIKFQQQIKSSRPNLDLSVQGILEGRTFSAEDSLKHGLIDSIGTIEDAANIIDLLDSLK